ncbi:odorant receptor 49a-like isoform X3 [Halictus rubicundus]|uniref:odorant receptor 49a-like isoform X3 n=1 Tax=Halictus rubicundus TaxID=77578 RepID=UPI0040364B5D
MDIYLPPRQPIRESSFHPVVVHLFLQSVLHDPAVGLQHVIHGRGPAECSEIARPDQFLHVLHDQVLFAWREEQRVGSMHPARGTGLENGAGPRSSGDHAETSVHQQIPDYHMRGFPLFGSPTYELVFFAHCVTAMVMQTITTAGYSLAATFVTHMCGQIRIQISRLDNLIDEYREKNNFQERIAVIVRDHAEVLRFSKDVEEGLREVCLTEIVESTLIMCLLEYYCLTEWENNDTVAILTYIMLLVSFTFIIFIFCYIGELLSEQCSKMGPAAYEIRWYNLSSKNSYDLIMLCAVALYPPKLSAGKIIDLSINTFGTVVKTSVLYLNLLRTFAT